MEVAVIRQFFSNNIVICVWHISTYTKSLKNELTFFPLPSHLSFALVTPEMKTLLVLIFVEVESIIIMLAISSGDGFIEGLLAPWWKTILSASESIRQPFAWRDILFIVVPCWILRWISNIFWVCNRQCHSLWNRSGPIFSIYIWKLHYYCFFCLFSDSDVMLLLPLLFLSCDDDVMLLAIIVLPILWWLPNADVSIFFILWWRCCNDVDLFWFDWWYLGYLVVILFIGGIWGIYLFIIILFSFTSSLKKWFHFWVTQCGFLNAFLL